MGFFSNFYPSNFKSNPPASPLNKPGFPPGKPVQKSLPPKPMTAFSVDKNRPDKYQPLTKDRFKNIAKTQSEYFRKLPHSSKIISKQEMEKTAEWFYKMQDTLKANTAGGYTAREHMEVLKKLDKIRRNSIGRIPDKEMKELKKKIDIGQNFLKGIIKK